MSQHTAHTDGAQTQAGPAAAAVSAPKQNAVEQPELSAPLPIQCSLTVGAPDDPLEDEADDMADRVMRMPDSGFIQRKCAECGKEEEGGQLQRKPLSSFIQRKGSGGVAASNETTSRIRAAQGGGSPLGDGPKSFMESRFGADFSAVRIHDGTEAAALSQDLSAQAFTVGKDVFFNSGRFSPETGEGKRLLAHELTHTIQQTGSAQRQMIQRDPIVLPPVLVSTPVPGTSSSRRRQLAQETARQNVIARDAFNNLNVSFEQFVDLWLTSANTALHQAVVPEDPTVRRNFYTALGGNMLWAATSLFATWHPIVIAMSFVGAAIGSGAAAADAAPTGIPQVAGLLTRTRDTLFRQSASVRSDVAIVCAQRNRTDLESQRQVLWAHIFPGVPYNSSDTLRELTLVRINAGLVQFRAQYDAWQSATEASGSHRAVTYCREIFPHNADGEGAARAGCIISFSSSFTAEARQANPFTPHLTF